MTRHVLCDECGLPIAVVPVIVDGPELAMAWWEKNVGHR